MLSLVATTTEDCALLLAARAGAWGSVCMEPAGRMDVLAGLACGMLGYAYGAAQRGLLPGPANAPIWWQGDPCAATTGAAAMSDFSVCISNMLTDPAMVRRCHTCVGQDCFSSCGPITLLACIEQGAGSIKNTECALAKLHPRAANAGHVVYVAPYRSVRHQFVCVNACVCVCLCAWPAGQPSGLAHLLPWRRRGARVRLAVVR